MRMMSPWRDTSSWSSVLIGDFAWHSLERKRRAAIDDTVEVMARGGGQPRVEILRSALANKHADRIGPELRVERVADLIRPPVLGEIHVHDLAKRMHAR